jgi:signal transduction histidine kinase
MDQFPVEDDLDRRGVGGVSNEVTARKRADAASPPRPGFGVVGMTERARLAGGTCRVESVPGRGTVVTARLATEPT